MLFTILSAQPTDLDQLNNLMYDLHQEHHAQCPEHFKSADEVVKEKSIASYLNNPECVIFVAKEQSQIVGFITGHFCELVSEVSKPVQMGSIDELYVKTDYRNLGVAKALVEKLEERFEEYGVKQVFVEVWEFNQTAQHFYDKLQFSGHIRWLRKAL
ncbi:GNAT family N-acetyltransferase [Vibrio sp. S4M6]|uniref:GNAT family N-acetyltransferase n=1 Tax=Vibrio sinus TaxID=2946865 RepID=UPI002029FFA2|nr:GNAT family N-acetyltransferase [Vibrio sinus]MCL9783141.1 GNAT family N-acetyltransferase [Vibrio sinus]